MQNCAAAILRAGAVAGSGSIVPSSGTTLLTIRPNFAWPAQGAGTKYLLQLQVSGSGRRICETITDKTELTYPADEPLPLGRKFEWHVSDSSGEGRFAPLSGVFSVATSAEVQEFATFVNLEKTAEAETLLLAAVAFEGRLFYDNALVCFERLRKSFPDEPVVLLGCARGYGRSGNRDAMEQTLNACASIYDMGGDFVRAKSPRQQFAT